MVNQFIKQTGGVNDGPNSQVESLLRSVINDFCDKQFHFDMNLKLYGSLHILADNEKVMTCLIDENLTKMSQVNGGVGCVSGGGDKQQQQKASLEGMLKQQQLIQKQKQQSKHKRKRFTPRALQNQPENGLHNPLSSSSSVMMRFGEENGHECHRQHNGVASSTTSSGDYGTSEYEDDGEGTEYTGNCDNVNVDDIDESDEQQHVDVCDTNEDDEHNMDGDGFDKQQVKRNKKTHTPSEAAAIPTTSSTAMPATSSSTTTTTTTAAPTTTSANTTTNPAMNGLAALHQLSNVAASQQLLYNRYLDEVSNEFLYKQQLQFLAQNLLSQSANPQTQQIQAALLAAAANASQQHSPKQQYTNGIKNGTNTISTPNGPNKFSVSSIVDYPQHVNGDEQQLLQEHLQNELAKQKQMNGQKEIKKEKKNREHQQQQQQQPYQSPYSIDTITMRDLNVNTAKLCGRGGGSLNGSGIEKPRKKARSTTPNSLLKIRMPNVQHFKDTSNQMQTTPKMQHTKKYLKQQQQQLAEQQQQLQQQQQQQQQQMLVHDNEYVKMEEKNLYIDSNGGSADDNDEAGKYEYDENNYDAQSGEMTAGMVYDATNGPNGTPNGATGATGVYDFECRTCEKSFKYFCYYKRHMDACHSDLPKYVCETCNKSYKWEASFRQHLRCHHNTNLSVETNLAGSTGSTGTNQDISTSPPNTTGSIGSSIDNKTTNITDTMSNVQEEEQELEQEEYINENSM